MILRTRRCYYCGYTHKTFEMFTRATHLLHPDARAAAQAVLKAGGEA